jgi:NADPH:quinone reductase-like Zn-dependent oxidoreductase
MQKIMATYKTILVNHYGGPEMLELKELPLPEPAPGEIRLKVLAAGVAFGDIQLRKGVSWQSLMTKLPLVPGYDVVGIVDTVGDQVSSVKPGQMVAAFTGTGGYSEYICIPANEAISVPDGIDPSKAVSVVLNYTTAYQMLHRTAHVQTGQQVLIHNAAGGVGSALMQLGKIAGLKMIGTASKNKLPLVAELGGTPIDYKNEDVIAQTRDLTNGQGVDAVFEGLGYRWWESYKLLKQGGHFVGYGLGAFSSKTWQRIPNILTRWSTVGLMRLRPDGRHASFYSIGIAKVRQPEQLRDDIKTLFDLLAAGQIDPIIARQFPLEKAADAHRLLESGQVRGKIVLTCV